MTESLHSNSPAAPVRALGPPSETLSPVSPLDCAAAHIEHELALAGRELLRDLVVKLTGGQEAQLPQALRENIPALLDTARFTSSDFSATPLSSLLARLFSTNETESQSDTERLAAESVRWLREKYGVADRPLFSSRDPQYSGSFRSPGQIRYSLVAPTLPPNFNPEEATSLTEVAQYIQRKWGGLSEIASPDRLIFSEMALGDTLSGLARLGYTNFFEVNAAYSTRGSRTILAFDDTSSSPTIVFSSFVSRDLFDHKLMQMRLSFPENFNHIRVLTSNAFRSWQVAELNVRKQLKLLPRDIPLDDVVLGYADVIRSELTKRGARQISSRPLCTSSGEEFATLTVYEVIGKTGISRHVGVFHDVALRYFGRSVLPLIEPLLERGVDRIIFAGSAGSLDRTVPQHGLVIPKVFLRDTGATTPPERIEIFNELHQLVPSGISHSGNHLSVTSPLVESQRFVDRRRRDNVTSVDVEGSTVAELIARHNKKTGAGVRFASAYIITDYPNGSSDQPSDIGLHDPRFVDKSATKGAYADILNLLWNIPGTHRPSNHTRLISAYLGEQTRKCAERGDDVALGVLHADIASRVEVISDYLARDRWVSLGLLKSYRDALRALSNAGSSPLRSEARQDENLLIEPIQAISAELQRVMMLQSLTRSATLSSGIVGYEAADSSLDVRKTSLRNATRAVDYILNHLDAPLSARAIEELHGILTLDVLQEKYSGAIRDFAYSPIAGPETRSGDVFREIVSWLESTPPSPLVAMEAYWRFEHLHPFTDSSGRVAELLAQHTMLRATKHPLLFPARFDIEYIMSLNRNGSDSRYKRDFTEQIVNRSVGFSTWLREYASDSDLASASYNLDHGALQWSDRTGKVKQLCLYVRTDRTIALEREQRNFLDKGIEPPRVAPAGTLVSATAIPYQQFDWVPAIYQKHVPEPPA